MWTKIPSLDRPFTFPLFWSVDLVKIIQGSKNGPSSN